MADFTGLFHVDRLSLILMFLVLFVGTCVGSFSVRYLKGDSRRGAFFFTMATMILSIFVMVCADHMLLFLFAWAASNLLLARLMLHKQVWEAARKSAQLAFRNFLLGFFFLALALLLFYRATGQTSIQALLARPIDGKWVLPGSMFLFLSAMTQSALWPFHRWLTSSLNSPTPVSAVMHAGLVNGGGFLLARFMPIFATQPSVLNIMFVTGIATALVGTLWKLMQSDIKRMLACSTMGQMGFMVAQCGLGLFPAAVAHLCWHGLFKAYLFLASGSAAKEKRLELQYPPSLGHFCLALICGIAAAYMFALGSGKKLVEINTNLLLVFIALIAGAQFALPMIRGAGKGKTLLALTTTAVMGLCYGLSVHLVEYWLAPLKLSIPQPLNVLHLIAAALLLLSWLAILFRIPDTAKAHRESWLKKYVNALNASQPHRDTITAHRNKYQY